MGLGENNIYPHRPDPTHPQIHDINPQRDNESHCSFPDNHDPLKCQKAFDRLLSKPKVNKFNGQDLKKYKYWKTSLQWGVNQKNITDDQWIQLLEVRTDGAVQKFVKTGMLMRAELGSDKVLVRIWSLLNKH